ncbi:MAG: hypothetical protein LUQ32_07260 [Methanomicrobiales archaeon]|nr:hypothetical protein [Methanomicrobiales archaeon]
MPHPVLHLIALAFLAGVTCGCLTPSTPETHPGGVISPASSVAAPLSIQINASPSRYNPAMSSTIGIRLTPVNTSGVIPSDTQFTWTTTFGSFYHWGPPDFKVTELGPRYTGIEEPVYWSYFSEHGEKERQPVNVTLTVAEASTGDILASTSLRIGWEDPLGFTAIVEGSE